MVTPQRNRGGVELAAIMRRLGLRRGDVARQQRVTVNAVGHWLAFRRKPSRSHAGQMAADYGIPAHWWDEQVEAEDAA